MSKEEVLLIGYWNGNEEDPEITFHVKEDQKDPRKLVRITLELVEERDSKASLRRTEKSLKRANKSLKNLAKSVKHWEK